MDNDVAKIRDKAYKKLEEIQVWALNEIDIWRNDLNLETEYARRLNAEKEVLTQRVAAYSAEEEATKKLLDQITAITQDIFTVDGVEQAQPKLHVTESNQILARFQDMVCHFEAKIAALHRQAGGHEADSSWEIDGDQRVSISPVRGSGGEEGAVLSRKAKIPKASLKPRNREVAPKFDVNGAVEQNNELADSNQQESKGGQHPTISTNSVAPDGQAPPLFTQTTMNTAFGLRSTSQLLDPAPKMSIDLGFGNVSSGPMFNFTSGQKSSGTQSGLLGSQTLGKSNSRQVEEGQRANVDINLSQHSVTPNRGAATSLHDPASGETEQPESRETESEKK